MAARHRREQARVVNSNAIQGDKMNLAARAGRWSAAHWKTATLGWLAFAVATVMLGSMHGTVKQTTADQTNGQAARAERMLTAAHVKSRASEYVLVRSQTLTARSSAFRRTVNDVRTKLEQTANTRNVRLGPVSTDGHFELVEFDVTGDADTADSRIQPALTAVSTLATAHPGFTISEVGDASISKAMNKVISDGIAKAEKLSLPITFTILLLAFGAFLAAGIPVLLAFTAVLAAIGLTHLGSSVIHEGSTTANMIVLMGMAVGVDYSLFYLKREREERNRGASKEDALQRAAATSGRAVLVSGLTVMTAAGGLMLSGNSVFTSLGLGTILVVLVAVIGSLTVLPALLSKLGDRVMFGRLPFLRSNRESRIWRTALRPALRYPKITAVSTVALLLVVASPVLHMHTRNDGVRDAPQNLAIAKRTPRSQRRSARPTLLPKSSCTQRTPMLRWCEARSRHYARQLANQCRSRALQTARSSSTSRSRATATTQSPRRHCCGCARRSSRPLSELYPVSRGRSRARRPATPTSPRRSTTTCP